jgi:proton-coupled amino acid transporter
LTPQSLPAVLIWFPDIGGVLYGKAMRETILASIVVSQLGFVCAYTIFIAENLQAFIMAITKCKTLLPIQTLIFSQLIVFLPLSFIRNLAKLSVTALVADVFILIGIVYIASNEVAVIAQRGIAEIQWLNEKDFPLLIG